MYIKAAFFILLGLASGYGFDTECGPMDENMFAALAALGKTPVDLRFPKSLPYPHLPAGKDRFPDIEHVVWLMMENHSFDHVYGLLNREGVDGFPLDNHGNPMTLVPQRYANGSTQLLYEMPSSCAGAMNGPSQNWQSTHQQYNNGSMDGFAIGGEQDKPIAMGYLTSKHLPTFHSLGEIFPLNDRFFASCPAQTHPNRMFALAGTSRGVTRTNQAIIPNVTWPNGVIFDTLDKYHISWTNYL
jgi:phospholipase C